MKILRNIIVHQYLNLKNYTNSDWLFAIFEDKRGRGEMFPAWQWLSEFKEDRRITSDGIRSGRPVEVVTPEMIGKIYEMLMKDRSSKVGGKA